MSVVVTVWGYLGMFCFAQAKTLCRYGCMYFFAALVLLSVDVMVMSYA